MFAKLTYQTSFLAPSSNKRDDIVTLMTGGTLAACPSWASEANRASSELNNSVAATWTVHSDTRGTNAKIVLKKNYDGKTLYCMLYQKASPAQLYILFSVSPGFEIANCYSLLDTPPTEIAEAGVLAMTSTTSYNTITIIDRPGFFAVCPNSSMVAAIQVTKDDPIFDQQSLMPVVVYDSTATHRALYHNSAVAAAKKQPRMWQLRHSMGFALTHISQFNLAASALQTVDMRDNAGDGTLRKPLASYGFCGLLNAGGWNTPISGIYISGHTGFGTGFTNNGTIYRWLAPGFLIPFE